MLEKKLHSTALEPETCVLIGLVQGRETREEVAEHLPTVEELQRRFDEVVSSDEEADDGVELPSFSGVAKSLWRHLHK